MRNPTLHSLLEAFTDDAAGLLANAAAAGEEIPFEVVHSDPSGRGARVPLYCYRPLTGAFIEERLAILSSLSTYAPAARFLEALDGTAGYLRHRGEARVSRDPLARADATLRSFLARVFEERSEFYFDRDRFEQAYDELERALYEGRCVTVVVAPVLGVALDPATRELALGQGLSLMRGDALLDAPEEAKWDEATGVEREGPNVLAVLRITTERSAPPPLALARGRFRRLLTALRLFERGGYSLGPLAWAKVDDGQWLSVPLGSSGRPGLPTTIRAAHEDELRAFCGLVSRRLPPPVSSPGGPYCADDPQLDSSGRGELTWALSRFEMGCERVAPFEALTDYLLALRALLEPEGPASGRLAQRLAVICARPDQRASLAERTAHAISLERAVIAGLAPARTGVDALVSEIAEHLRAILRDVICGHLDIDVRGFADELLVEAALAAA